MVADFQHPDNETVPAYWFDSFAPRQTRRGRVIERGPLVRDAEDALTWTSMAETVTLFPAHMTRYWVRPDITYLPVKDLDALLYAMVWRSSDAENELIRSLARVVRDLGSLDGGNVRLTGPVVVPARPDRDPQPDPADRHRDLPDLPVRPR
jgi:hypothetical protein